MYLWSCEMKGYNIGRNAGWSPSKSDHQDYVILNWGISQTTFTFDCHPETRGSPEIMSAKFKPNVENFVCVCVRHARCFPSVVNTPTNHVLLLLDLGIIRNYFCKSDDEDDHEAFRSWCRSELHWIAIDVCICFFCVCLNPVHILSLSWNTAKISYRFI